MSAHRRALPTAVVGALLLAVAACSSAEDCTLIGAEDQLSITVEPPVRTRAAEFEVELCQAQRCRSKSFAATPLGTDGVQLMSGTYQVLLATLGSGWDGDRKSTLTITARDEAGQQVLSRTETFRFEKNYPNGKGCEPEQLIHKTTVDSGDLTRS